MKRLCVILVMGWAMQIGFVGAMVDYPEEIPFVSTPIEVVDQMLELAEVKKGDIVYDLGSGDGRIVIRAAKKYGARGIGIEMDRTLIDKARRSAQAEGISHLVEFRVEDALKTDISPATVVTLYMYLKPDSRIVAHDFGIEGWTPVKTKKLPEIEHRSGGYKHQHVLYLWKID